jgi:hypothetical protein
VKRLYLKFFDVVWEETRQEPIPVSVVNFQSTPPPELEIVPTVFLTNDVLKRLSPNQVGDLAGKTLGKIESLRKSAHIDPINEVQLDCDWTTGTRDKYFQMLRSIRTELHRRNVKLSATIRLHQIKYRERTGVPPVDRGMLMFYNMASPVDPSVQNSIIDWKIAHRYTERLNQYPLGLDLALPIYSWGVLFEDQRFIALIDGLRREDLQDRSRFGIVGSNRYQVKRDSYLLGERIHRGDTIRFETSEAMVCSQAARDLSKRIPGNNIYLSLFHYDPKVIGGFGREETRHIFSAFR